MKRKQVSPDHLLHQEVAQLLSAYLDGQVDDRERHLIEQHLSTCPVCQGDLESLRRVVRLLNRLPAVTPPHPFTLRPEWVTPTRPPVWRWLFGIPGLATGLAALMCVVVLAGALLYNRLGPHRAVIPLARMPVTYSIPTPSTVESVPGVTSTVTPIIPSPEAAHDELGVLVATPLSMPTLASPVPSQPVAPLMASPVPSPEAPEKGYKAPSPTLLVMQPEGESAAKTQPAPQRTEVTVEEGMQAQRYEGAASPEPSFTAPPAVGAMAVSAATETPAAQLPSGETMMPSEPPPAVVAEALPATEIPGASMPSVEKAVLPPEPSPAAETPVMSPAVPMEAPTMPSLTQAPVVPAEPLPTVEAMAAPSVEAPVISAEPSPAAEALVVPTATPLASPTEEALPSTAEEVVPVTPTAVQPEATEAPGAGPTETAPTPTRVLIPVRELRLTIKPGLIRIEGALPLPPGQLIQAELWREGQLMEWAIPETQRGKVHEEGRFELELKAPPDQPGFDLFRLPPARYELRIVPLEFEAAVEARIPFDTFPPATKQP